MSVIEVDWKPDRRKLRQFALTWLVGFSVVGLMVAWKVGVFSGSGWLLAPVILWGLAVGVGLPGLAAPGAVRPVYLAWMALAFPIGWLLSHIILAVIYYGVFTPVACVFRLMRRDLLARRFDREAESYWVRRKARDTVDRHFRQF